MGEVGVQPELAAWLGQCVDEDERLARAATVGPWTVNDADYPESVYGDEGGTCVIGGGRWGGEAPVFEQDVDALHIVAWDPARVLAECESKRRVVEMYMEECRSLEAWPGSGHSEVEVESLASIETLGGVLRLMAVVYKDRDGYRAEWSPDGR